MLDPIGFEEATMTPREPIVSINMSGIQVSGVGGLGLVAVAALMTYEFPEARWLVGFGAIGGALLACAIVAFRRHHISSSPSGDDPKILFRADAPAGSRPVPRRTLELRTRTVEP
jgi:predicted membrane protein